MKEMVSHEEMITWRRYLHMHPELSYEEVHTSQFVYEVLQTFPNLEITRPTPCSVMARLVGNRPGKVLAIRADMDALAIHEENDVPFVSKHPGVMHACGHDGHTATLLGVVKELAHRKDEIEGEVRFFFQHAEEIFPGGAQQMIDAGVMDGVDYVMGAHLWSPLDVGKIGIVYGTIMAAPDVFTIEVFGKGGHAGIPQETIDSIAIGTQIVSNLQHIVSRNVNPFDPLVVSVTQFHAGTAYNIIPEHAVIKGTVRSMNESVRQETAVRMEAIIKGITEAHGASYSFTFDYGYRPVINDDAVTEKVETTAVATFGQDAVVRLAPSMVGEDFSAYLQHAPGCFFFIGARNEEKGFVYPHHHPRFMIDEDALLIGKRLFVEAAFAILAKK